jgi:Ca-activated chloride channel family protein
VRLPEELDEVPLRQIAETTRGAYFRATDLKSLKEIYSEIDKMEKTDIKSQTFTDYRDVFWPLLIAAFLIFSTELFLSLTLFRRVP